MRLLTGSFFFFFFFFFGPFSSLTGRFRVFREFRNPEEPCSTGSLKAPTMGDMRVSNMQGPECRP